MIGSQTADVAGFLGGIVILAAYAWQTLREARPGAALNALNFVGASLLALSLAVNYNLPALVLEIIWASIAFTGLARNMVMRR